MKMMWENEIKESWPSTQVTKGTEAILLCLNLSVHLDLDYNYKPTYCFSPPTIYKSHVSLLLILLAFTFYL